MNLFFCKKNDLQTVDTFESQRYLGKWYEIARLPNRFEKGLIKISATYTDNQGAISVLNEGTDEASGQVKKIKGIAKIKGPGRLKVSFFRPFYAPYYIIALDKDYQFALVGSPSRKYLWILCREKQLEENIMKELLENAEKLGFNTKLVVQTAQ